MILDQLFSFVRLILTRRRQFADMMRSYRIVIDGNRGAPIRPGQTVWIELPPGHHEVTARLDWCGSRRVEIEASLEGHHHFEVGSNLTGWRCLGIALLSTGCPLLVLAITLVGSSWHAFVVPIVISILCLPAIAFLTFWRDGYLYLKEIPTFPMTAQQTAVIPDRALRFSNLSLVQPLRAQFSLRWMMIAVAIVAVAVWATIEGARIPIQHSFRSKAALHARMEEIYRESEESMIRLAREWEKKGVDVGQFRQGAARADAGAKYHAAMKRKYEQAAAEGWFSAEPDPPAPIWP